MVCQTFAQHHKDFIPPETDWTDLSTESHLPNQSGGKLETLRDAYLFLPKELTTAASRSSSTSIYINPPFANQTQSSNINNTDEAQAPWRSFAAAGVKALNQKESKTRQIILVKGFNRHVTANNFSFWCLNFEWFRLIQPFVAEAIIVHGAPNMSRPVDSFDCAKESSVSTVFFLLKQTVTTPFQCTEVTSNELQQHQIIPPITQIPGLQLEDSNHDLNTSVIINPNYTPRTDHNPIKQNFGKSMGQQ